MQPLALRNPEVYGTAAALALGAGALLYFLFRKQPSEDELERRRREALVLSGRIIDGTVLDIADLTEEESGREGGMQLVMYQYEVAGVTYECSQDVSTLGDYLDIHDMRLGGPCSVRYKPNQPTNSILIAETWSGLRELASGVPIRRNAPAQTTQTQTAPANTNPTSA